MCFKVVSFEQAHVASEQTTPRRVAPVYILHDPLAYGTKRLRRQIMSIWQPRKNIRQYTPRVRVLTYVLSRLPYRHNPVSSSFCPEGLRVNATPPFTTKHRPLISKLGKKKPVPRKHDTKQSNEHCNEHCKVTMDFQGYILYFKVVTFQSTGTLKGAGFKIQDVPLKIHGRLAVSFGKRSPTPLFCS